MQEHDLAIDGFCPSVCLSHTGTGSKLMTVQPRSFHHRLAQGSPGGLRKDDTAVNLDWPFKVISDIEWFHCHWHEVRFTNNYNLAA